MRQKKAPANAEATRSASTQAPGRMLLDLPTLKKKLCVSSDSFVYAMIRKGLLPPPVKFSRKCSRWFSDETELAIAKLPRGTHSTPTTTEPTVNKLKAANER